LQALLGGVAAGVIALFLYKFATTIEASLNRQTISDNFSVSSPQLDLASCFVPPPFQIN
jgi:ABC-type sulfate transport system permease subunit